jgi:hypothetical protein
LKNEEFQPLVEEAKKAAIDRTTSKVPD